MLANTTSNEQQKTNRTFFPTVRYRTKNHVGNIQYAYDSVACLSTFSSNNWKSWFSVWLLYDFQFLTSLWRNIQKLNLTSIIFTLFWRKMYCLSYDMPPREHYFAFQRLLRINFLESIIKVFLKKASLSLNSHSALHDYSTTNIQASCHHIKLLIACGSNAVCSAALTC